MQRMQRMHWMQNGLVPRTYSVQKTKDSWNLYALVYRSSPSLYSLVSISPHLTNLTDLIDLIDPTDLTVIFMFV